MRHSDAFVYIVGLAYVGTISLAFVAAHSFTVLSFGEIVLLAAVVLPLPLIIAIRLAKESERFVLAAAHILLAVLLHPEIQFREPLYLSSEQQHELLARTHDGEESWWNAADLAYDLSRSLASDAKIRFKISSPFWYWAFPPSLALGLWGTLLYFFFPKGGKEKDEHT